MATRNVNVGINANPGGLVAGFELAGMAARGFENTVRATGGSLSAIGQSMALVAAPITLGLVGATKSAIAFESAVSAASRALDFTDAQAAKFSDRVLSVAPKLGILPSEYINFVTEAGKLGVPQQEIEKFAELVASTQAATDAGAIAISQNFATVRAVFKYTVPDLERYAATVNALDDQIGGTFATITEFVERTGATGKLAGLTAEQLAAMGATYARLGVAPERAATAMNSFISKLSAFNSLSDKSKEGLFELGYTSTSLQASLDKGFSPAMLDFFERLQKLAPEKQMEMLVKVFGRESADEIATLVAGYDSYAQAVAVLGKEQENLNKLEAEREKKLGQTTGGIKVLQANMERLAVIVGTTLLPPLNEILQIITPMVEKVADFAQANPQITKMAVAFGLVVAIAAPLLIIAGAVVSSFAALAPIIAFVLNPLTLMVGAVAALHFHLKGIDNFGDLFKRIGSLFGENNKADTSFGSDRLKTSPGGHVNINFSPNYNISGIGAQAVDAGRDILGYVRNNDRRFLEVIQDAANRVGRSFFG